MSKVLNEIGEFRKYYCMKTFLYFCIISPCSNDIENKTWKTFNNTEMQISLAYKCHKTTNEKAKTTKRKS